MPLPIIIGAAALAATAFGGKKAYDGYQKHSEADGLVSSSKEMYNRHFESFQNQEKETQGMLESLGALELEIGKGFHDFEILATALIDQLSADAHKKLEIHIPQHQLQKIENYSYSAIGVLGSMVGAGVAGAAAGFAVYGGVMALGAASTGTAISTLAGAAATNATLAAIGGGSLAAGGMGIAGGTAILGAAVAAPVLAIAAWAYDGHGEEALKNARQARREARSAADKLDKGEEFLKKAGSYARKIRRNISRIYTHFSRYHDELIKVEKSIKEVRDSGSDAAVDLQKFSDHTISIIENGYALAAILTDIITTPIFKIREVDGVVIKDDQGVPEMEKDADGSMILNSDEVELALDSANAAATRYFKE